MVHKACFLGFWAVFSLSAVALGPESGESAETDESANAFPLPEVVVIGKKIEAPPSLVVRQVSAEDISARAAHTVGRALVHVPGVNIQVGGSSGDARAWIRGYRDRDVLVLFDGIPVASGFEGTIDLNEIAVQRISAVKVLKSAPSVIYGTNGVGGVIDVIPQRPPGKFYLDGIAELGTDGRRLLRASGGGGSGQLSLSISAQYQSADEYSLSGDYEAQENQPRGTRVNSDFERSSVLLSMDARDWLLGDTSLFINLADTGKGLPVEAGVDDPDYERLTESKRHTIGLSNHFSGIPLSLKLYYNGYDSELASYTDASFSEIDEVERTEDFALGGKLYSTLHTSENNSLVLTGGVQTDRFTGEGELESGSKAELTTWTLAIEDEYWVGKTLSMAVGGIFTYFDQTLLDRSSSEFNPQLALSWQVQPQITLHASAAQRTRFPKLRELYRRRYGNPELDPQTSENYEVGISYRHNPSWISDVSLFYSHVDGLIEREDRRSPYTNLDPVTISGLEAATNGWFGDHLMFRLAYTYVDAAEDLPGGGSRQLRSRPTHTVISELRYELPWEMMLSLGGIYVSGLYDLDPDGVYTRLPSYFVADFRASWAILESSEVYLAVRNLGDRAYLQRIGDPREGRAAMLGLQLVY
ncbi:MAG: TonB-dependent receptor [Xanthomonadales bacterium]|nr:TonB-dependent receptor [Xanthomonadales bacterium]